MERERPPGGGWHGRAHATFPDAVPGIPKGGSLPAPPEHPERHWPPGVRRRKALPCRGLHRSTGAHRRRAKVRIGPPRRLRTPVRP